MKSSLKGVAIFLSFCISIHGMADTGSDYRNAKAYIANQQLSENLITAVSHAAKTLPAVLEPPEQERYYNHSNSIASDTVSKINTPNAVGKIVHDNALARPKFTVNMQSPEMKFSQKIQDNADAIVDGSYKDCNSKAVTGLSYQQKTCETSRPFTFSCVKTLNVHMEQRWVTVQKSMGLSGRLQMTGGSNAGVSMDVASGFVTGLSLHVRDGGNPWSCSQSYGLMINGVTVGRYHGQCGKYLGDLQFDVGGVKIPFNHKFVTLTLLGGGLSGTASGSLSLSYNEKQRVPIKKWISSCASIPATCSLNTTRCLEANTTKNIDGIALTERCWKKVVTHQCGAAVSTACRTLEGEGCTQVGSRCSKMESGVCTLFSETWSCPDKKIIGHGIRCGKRFFCLEGSCQTTHHEKNNDFGRVATELSAVSAAAKDVKSQGVKYPHINPKAIRIFSGRAAYCRDITLGIMNCCNDTGWAKGIFTHCRDEEKQLGLAKEKGGLVVPIGRYCSNKVLGACVEHRKGYCVFPSRIAFDVQVDGRKGQLNRDFGSGKSPNCSGLSPSEIGKIHFDKIDFSNIINSVANKTKYPSNDASKKRIADKIKKMATRENPNG